MTFNEWFDDQIWGNEDFKTCLMYAWEASVANEREACAKELDAEAARLDALGVYGDDAEYVAKLATAMRSNA